MGGVLKSKGLYATAQKSRQPRTKNPRANEHSGRTEKSSSCRSYYMIAKAERLGRTMYINAVNNSSTLRV